MNKSHFLSCRRFSVGVYMTLELALISTFMQGFSIGVSLLDISTKILPKDLYTLSI